MTQSLSASRLNDFLACRHRARLWLDGIEPPAGEEASAELVRRKGFEHEAAVLAALEAEHGPAARISGDQPLAARRAATDAAMAAGTPLIYQGALSDGSWVGYPDFLVRQNGGGWRPEDAKLARRAKAEHLIQLNVYARLFEAEHGGEARTGVIRVGGGGDPETFDLRQTRHIAARLAADFERFAHDEARQSRAVKSAACEACAYAARCEAEWRAADSPVRVAGSRADQIVRLEQAGVTTLAGLAACDPAQPKGGIGAESFARLVAQARLQLHHRERGEHRIELLPVEPQRGFVLLPPPAPGDLFFDIEGDPLYPEGLDYLFGLFGPLAPSGAERFCAFWGHDNVGEKAAFEALMRLFVDHLARFEGAHIFHYAAYETTALKRLAMRYASFEEELDDLLRGQRFVDLYRVARQALRCSTEGYSLKDLEKIYGPPREGEVVNAAESIVQYELWREVADAGILDAIERYNEEDCRSTARLRDWLERQRPAGASFGLADIPPEPDEASLEWARKREEREADRRALAGAIRASDAGDGSVRDLLAELLWFHQRAQKPVHWQRFDRQTWTDEELVEDMESLGRLERMDQRLDKRSFEATYRFPPQDTRLKEGSTPSIAADLNSAGTIKSLDLDEGRLILRRGTGKGDFPPACSLSPGLPIKQTSLIEGVRSLVAGLCEEPDGQPALMDFL
ncbi:MAG: TM0106 family RecB-like putative nuclease, partial [Caulobacteraceae bacterium]